jgi:hypothetical protein
MIVKLMYMYPSIFEISNINDQETLYLKNEKVAIYEVGVALLDILNLCFIGRSYQKNIFSMFS